MKSFTKLCKYGLAIAPIGGIAYLSHPNYVQSQLAFKPEEPKLQGYFKQYVEENNLVSPGLYKKFQEKYTFNHFFEQGILKDLQGLDNYNLFINKSSHDALTNEVEVSDEQKKKLLEQAKLHCTFSAKSNLQGNSNAIHSGFTSTIFDNVAGCLAFMACDLSPAVTAYLNVRHEQPMTVGNDYVAVVEVDRVEGRKVFLKGKIMDKENNVYANMESLFVKPKKDAFYLRQLYKYFLIDNKEKKVEKISQDAPSVPYDLWKLGSPLTWTSMSN
jgi:acyl-coenzyme A thioesterase PaaI-like protein